MTSPLDLVSFVNAPLMKIATREDRWPARGALFLSRATFLVGGQENDRILVVRLIRTPHLRIQMLK